MQDTEDEEIQLQRRTIQGRVSAVTDLARLVKVTLAIQVKAVETSTDKIHDGAAIGEPTGGTRGELITIGQVISPSKGGQEIVVPAVEQ